MALTLATRITIARILGVPVFVLLLMYYNRSVDMHDPRYILRVAASIFYVCIFLLDALDGYIARSRNQITRLGALLDPLADKALLLSAIIILGRPSVTSFNPNIPMWFVIMVLSRDAILIVGATVIHLITGTVEIRPRLFGKATTFFQMTVVIWVLVGFSHRLFPWILWCATGCTLMSLVQYIYDGVKQLEREQHSPSAATAQNKS